MTAGELGKLPRMGSTSGFDIYQRWRRPLEVGIWVAFFALNGVFNSINSRLDHADARPWEPWLWEWSSLLVLLALLPAVIALERRWPIRFDTWRRNLPLHLMFSVPFSLVHVSAMHVLRQFGYRLAHARYDGFGASWWVNYGYEYLKDVRTYFVIVGVLVLYRLWLLRQQGEARLLAEPDEGVPVEPVERPERFLVRKLGKEFLVNASEIEWLQASGNYVNLRVRGRDYPLRATLSGIEERLDPARFVRVHRSHIVNLDYLVEMEPLETGDARLQMRDGARLPCSRRYRAALRERCGQPA